MSTIQKRKDSNQIVACFLIGFYFMYNVFLVPIGLFVPRLSILVLLFAGIFTVAYKKIVLTKEYWFLLGFIVYSFMTGVLLAYNSGVVIHQTLFLVESLLAGIIILTIAKDTKSLRIIIGMFAFGAILTTVYFLLSPGLMVGARLSFDEEFNANTLGVMLMYGVWCVIFAINCDKTTISKAIITVVISLFILFILVQTGSRKSVLGTIVILTVFLIYLTLSGGGYNRKLYNLLIAGSVIALISYVYFYYIDSFLDAADVLINRMENIQGSEDYRTDIIKDSFRVFTEHPIFGVGLDNNRYYTIEKLYAHNSYLEILACTGIIGALLFLPIFWCMLSFVFNRVRRIKTLLKQPLTIFFCVLIMVFLLICMAQINIYNQTHMFITYLILTYLSKKSYTNEKNINRYI